jgi:hypothetical protein
MENARRARDDRPSRDNARLRAWNVRATANCQEEPVHE